jgi:hypothetical protein
VPDGEDAVVTAFGQQILCAAQFIFHDETLLAPFLDRGMDLDQVAAADRSDEARIGLDHGSADDAPGLLQLAPGRQATILEKVSGSGIESAEEIGIERNLRSKSALDSSHRTRRGCDGSGQGTYEFPRNGSMRDIRVFYQDCDALTAADAGCGNAVTQSAAPDFPRHGDRQAHAGGAERMS